MRLYARKCTVQKISNYDAKEFCNIYHKQGGLNNSIASYGLFNNGDLVQVETFGNDRFSNKYDYELLRECSKKDYYILGGKSKLLKAFIRDYDPYNIVSYCSLEEGFDGHSYIDCGFTLVRKQTGSYHYLYDNRVVSRNKMQKNSHYEELGKRCPIHNTLRSIGKEYIYSSSKTEKEMTQEAGFIRVEEKGNLVFEMILKEYVGIIYKTTNKVNNKIYIGQHNKSDDNYLGSGSLILEAIKKYGKDNFVRETLETVHDNNIESFRKQLNDREIYYIKKFNTLDKSIGYNILPGGQSSHFIHSKEDIIKKGSETKHNNYINGKNKLGWTKGISLPEDVRKKVSETLKKNYAAGKYKVWDEGVHYKLSEQSAKNKSENIRKSLTKTYIYNGKEYYGKKSLHLPQRKYAKLIKEGIITIK